MWLLRLIRENPKVGLPIFFIAMLVGFLTDKDPKVTEAQTIANARIELESRMTTECIGRAKLTEAQCRCFGAGLAQTATDSDFKGQGSKQELKDRASAVLSGCLNAKPPPEPVVLAQCKVASAPAGASVTVDGKKVDGVTPTTVQLVVGHPNQVTASLAGFKTVSQSHEPLTPTNCDGLTFALFAAREVKLVSRPAGAAVFVDGVRVEGGTPLNLELDVTAHEVMFTMQARGTVKQSIEAGNDKATVLVELRPVAFVELTSAPEAAEVWVDGVKQPSATPTAVEVTSGGVHFLTLAKEGFLPRTVTLAAMTPGDSTEKSVSLGRGGRAQLKTCANQSKAKAKALEKKGASAEAGARRAEAEWCLAHP
jgi:hypothetical protein